MKQKMDPVTKMKLIYSIELIVIAIVAMVLAILEITYVLHLGDVFINIFNWVTIFGGAWLIIDFFWTMFSPKRKAKNCLLDKIVLLPLGAYLITFDLIALIGRMDHVYNYDFFRMGVSIALLYLAAAYIFQGIYHWFYPLPMIMEDVAKEEQNEPIKEEPVSQEQPKEEKESEDKEA